jgi:hypothetical protein
MPKPKKEPLDSPQLAPPQAVRDYMRALGKKGGPIGGKRRLETMTPKQRSAVAKKAAIARWRKKASQTP